MSGPDLRVTVRQTIAAHDMVGRGERVLVACSGGPDSTALVLLLWELQQELDCRLHVVHLNHRFRGADADADAAFVVDLSRSLGLPCTVASAPVPWLVRRWRVSAQVAARRARLDLCRRLARVYDARHIALGHNREDQAETVLLRLLRGTGVDGLAGMRPVRDGLYIRPLLAVSRGDIEAFLQERGIAPRRDPSNRRPAYRRNRVRHRLLPYIRSRFSPRFVDHLVRLSRQAADDADFLADLVRQEWKACGGTTASGRAGLDAARLARLHPAMQRRLVRELYRRATGRHYPLGFDHVETVREVAAPGRGPRGPVSLPAAEAGVEGRRLYVTAGRAPVPPAGARYHLAAAALSVPGWTRVPGLAAGILAEFLEGPVAFDSPSGPAPSEAYLDAAAVRLPLRVRFRRPGDRFRPLGLGGTKKLQDYFIDAGLPRRRRQHVPLVIDASGRIIWVALWRIDDDCRLRPETRSVLYLRLTGPRAAADPPEGCLPQRPADGG